MMGTMTRSVGMYRSFPTSSNPIPRDLAAIQDEYCSYLLNLLNHY